MCRGPHKWGPGTSHLDPRLAGQAGLDQRWVLRSHGSRQELAAGNSKAVMGMGQMGQCLLGELMRKGGSGQEGVCVNNIETCITFFFSFNLLWLHRHIA